MKRVFLLIFFLLNNCAYLADRNQIVKIDSTSRSYEVYDKNLNYLGKTPLALDIPRQKRHQFFLGVHGDKKSYELDMNCSYRYFSSGLANSAFFLLTALPLALGTMMLGLGVDYVTSSSFDCSADQMVAVKPIENEAEVCDKYLVFPANYSNYPTSFRLAKLWVDAIKPKINSCSEFVDFHIAKKSIEKIYPLPNKMKKDQLKRNLNNKLTFDTNATKLILLTSKIENENVYLEATTVDLFNYEEKSKPEWSAKFKIDGQYIEKENFFIDYSLAFLPNSFGVLSDRSKYSVNENSGYKARDLDKKPFITDILIGSVDHPDHFAPWDYKLYFFSSVMFRRILRDVQIEDTIALKKETIALAYYRIIPYAQLKIGLFTPLGSFSGAVGAGPAYHILIEDSGSKKSESNFLYLTSFDYVAFLTDNLFIQFGLSHYYFSNEIASKHFFVKKNHEQVNIGIGYYFPELGNNIRKSF